MYATNLLIAASLKNSVCKKVRYSIKKSKDKKVRGKNV